MQGMKHYMSECGDIQPDIESCRIKMRVKPGYWRTIS